MPDDYATRARRYAERVISGETPACRWVRLACQRHLDDLESALKPTFQWRFDIVRANSICDFIEGLPHVKGKWKSANITVEDWQCFILCCVFGWVDKGSGVRRFRKALVVVPRKNGKSPIAAGVGLYLLIMDDEPGAEVYSAATTRDQAKIVWGEYARKMLLRTPELRYEFGVEPLANSITVESTGSFFKPLSRDVDSLEGLNIHGGIVDELHAHKTREVFDVLDDGTGARRQPLLFIISTEGNANEGVFPEQVDYLKGVLEGTHEDDSYFGLIYTIDADDDWTQPASWQKCNPNYGISVSAKDLEVRCRQAIANPASQSSFLTKRCNVRVGAGSAFFNMLAWGTVCKDESLKLEDFYGQPCLLHLDLASKLDIAAKVYLFQRATDYVVFGRYYLPSDVIAPGAPNYDFYRGWADSNRLTLTEGNRTDYSTIETQCVEDMRNFQILAVGVDPLYNAEQLTQRLKDIHGLPMQEVPHNVPTFSEPMKTIEALIVAGKIKHNGDPVMTWAIGNTIAKRDAKDNVYPRKSRNDNKIDPAVALIAVVSLSLRRILEQQWDFEVVAV